MPGAPVPLPPPGVVAMTGPAVAALPTVNRKPTKKMKKFNWNKLPVNRAHSSQGQTVWDRVQQVQSQKHQGTALDHSAVETLFAQQQVEKKVKKKEEKKKDNAVVSQMFASLLATSVV
jgi:hypothetical protein